MNGGPSEGCCSGHRLLGHGADASKFVMRQAVKVLCPDDTGAQSKARERPGGQTWPLARTTAVCGQMEQKAAKKMRIHTIVDRVAVTYLRKSGARGDEGEDEKRATRVMEGEEE